MWKAIERLKQGESINVQDLETNLYWEFGKFTSRDGESLELYYSRSQKDATRNRGKEIVNSPSPTYDQEPTMVAEDYDLSKEKEIDKLMALISLSFKKIYKPTNNNLRTSSNTSRANQDNTPRINRGTKQADWRDDTDDELDDQELEAHYMYMAHIQEVTPDTADNSGPIFNAEPLQNVQNNNDNYNVFATESEHPEQPESDDHDDNDDVAKECDLIASLIEKLKCEIDDTKNRNKFLETSNKALVDKLKGEIEGFKTKNKSLESSNNHFKEASNELSKTNQLMFKDLKKFQAKLDRYHDVNYASKVAIDCAKAKGDLMEYYYVDHMNVILGVYTTLDEFTDLHCGYVDQVVKCERLEKELSKSNITSKSFEALQKHDIDLELDLKQYFSKSKSITTNNVSNDFSKQVTAQILPQNMKSILKNTSVIAPGMYKVHTKPNKTRTPQLPQEIRKTKKHVSFSTGVIPTTSVSRPQLKSNRLEDIVMHNNSEGKKQQVEDHRNVTIKRVYYVEGLNHNLFSIGQFYDTDLGVAFWKSTCYIRDLKGNDLLIGSRSIDLYPITLQDTSTPNPICLMAKASSSQAWLWHRHLSHLNFDTINLLSKYDIVTGLPKLKFVIDHLCSSCELGKAKYTPLLNIQTTPETTSQAPTQVPTVTTNEKIIQAETNKDYAQVEEDEFINIFSTPVQERGETSSRYVDSLNMHTFYQRHPSEHRWTRDHPLEQVIGNPSQSIRTRRQLETDGKMCMFALIVSRTEPKNIQETMAYFAWIEAIQEELHQFDRLDVWELVDRPLYKNVINMKWLWKNKHDEENTVIRNKARLVAKGYSQQEGIDPEESFALIAR
ncbi:retrovirus-related pol polyprotein from transposon TNT 1-94 [Tanacetum coccineum]